MNNNSNSLGKSFIWIAWIIAIALLVYIFQGVLDKQWNPNQQPSSHLSTSGKASVTLKQNRQGHYVTNGTINETPVVFLLDTGATQVSIPSHIAQQIGLTGTGSYPVQTANGTVTVYRTHLDSLSIGNIYLYDINAHINPAMRSDEILLGMSALKKVEFSQTGNQLVLTQR
ncbi:retropepsin-like aspartic protease family protein [Colwellia sp. MEBiC06753]